MNDQPALACLVPGHLVVTATASIGIVASWCLWCGTGVYDPDTVTAEGVCSVPVKIGTYGKWGSRWK